ncbi:MAG: hypothetical protein AAF703_07445 [Cyanobacteria bacterium P01_D01_bin.105]
MRKFPVLLAAVNLVVAAPIAAAQEETLSQPNVIQFLSDSAPAECTIQTVAIPSEAPAQSTEDIFMDVPETLCDAVSGTDDGSSKNFNFLNLSGSNFYKVITSSEPVADTEGETYQFSVEGVKIVPLDAEGNTANLSEVDYLYPADSQVCIADAVDQPRSVICTFEVKDAENVLLGQLKYLW